MGLYIILSLTSLISAESKISQPLETIVAGSSEYNDIAPALSADKKICIFQSNRKPNSGSIDLYETKYINNEWQEPVNITSINTEFFEGFPALSADGNSLYFATNRGTKDKNNENLDIWISKRDKNDKWLHPVPIENINSEAYDAMPSISADGNTIYFVSKREGGPGGLDIWYSNKKKENSWESPKVLEANINSVYHEVSPVISASGKELFFASNKNEGFGGFDLYMSILDTTTNKYTTALNLGADINSKDHEYLFSLSYQENSFYISKGEQGVKNIISAPILQNINITPVLIFNAIIENNDIKDIEKINIQLIEKEKSVIREIMPRKNNNFSTVLSAGSIYSLIIKHPDFEEFNANINLTKLNFSREKYFSLSLNKKGDLSENLGLKEISTENIETKEKPAKEENTDTENESTNYIKSEVVPLSFSGVEFLGNTLNLDDESKLALRIFYRKIQDKKINKMKITALINENKSKKTNENIAYKRAEAVLAYFLTLGLNKAQAETNIKKVTKLESLKTIEISIEEQNENEKESKEK
ncbi:MAG: hypothetical protein OEZ22_07180 [Spirochaetia bacterium]|nr:hypothetical protein [Spirochaetia bacterium]